MLATCRDQTNKILVTTTPHHPPKKEGPRLLWASVLSLRLVCDAIFSLHIWTVKGEKRQLIPCQPSCLNAWYLLHAYKLQPFRAITETVLLFLRLRYIWILHFLLKKTRKEKCPNKRNLHLISVAPCGEWDRVSFSKLTSVMSHTRVSYKVTVL